MDKKLTSSLKRLYGTGPHTSNVTLQIPATIRRHFEWCAPSRLIEISVYERPDGTRYMLLEEPTTPADKILQTAFEEGDIRTYNATQRAIDDAKLGHTYQQRGGRQQRALEESWYTGQCGYCQEGNHNECPDGKLTPITSYSRTPRVIRCPCAVNNHQGGAR